MKLLKILFILSLSLLLIGILLFFSLSEFSQNARFVSVSQKTIQNDIDTLASITSEHQYTLYSPSEGNVLKLNYQLGDEVSKGQRLAEIKKDENLFSDNQSETRLRNLITQHTLTIQQGNDELERICNAVNAGVMPRYKLEEVRSNIQKARSRQQAAESELRSYKRDKSNRRAYHKKKTVIEALSGGLITKVAVQQGQWVRKGDPLFDVISTDDLTLKAMMSPQNVSKLSIGQDVIVAKQNTSQSWHEEVLRISPIISQNPISKNLQEVTISLNNAADIQKSINEKVKIKVKRQI